MPNWCSNYVTFSSKDEEKLQPLNELFTLIKSTETDEKAGDLPHYISDPDGHLFQLIWDNPNLQFESKWAPPIKVIQQIADEYKLDFTLEYDEPSMHIYGRYTYKDKVLTDICLDDTDFAQFEWQEDTEKYRFEGKDWESDSEIKELLLTRKIQQHGSV